MRRFYLLFRKGYALRDLFILQNDLNDLVKKDIFQKRGKTGKGTYYTLKGAEKGHKGHKGHQRGIRALTNNCLII